MDKWTQDEKLNKALDLLVRFGQGDFTARTAVGNDDDRFNNILSALNMLGEELSYYRTQLDEKTLLLGDIFENISEVVYTMYLDRKEPDTVKIDFISPHVKEMIGYTANELLEKPSLFYDAIHPDDLHILDTARAGMLETGAVTTCVYRVRPKDGEHYVWIEDKMTPKLNEGGEQIRFFCCARDVSDEKMTIEELEHNSKLVSRMIETSDQFFYAVTYSDDDPFSSHVSYASDYVTEINGATVEQVMADPNMWYECIHPDDIEHVVETNRSIFRSGRAAVRVYRVRHLVTGQYTWVEDHVHPSYDSNRRLTELYGSARIITERKEYEERINSALEELEKQQLFIDTILSSSPIEMVVFNEKHQYLYISQQAIKDEAMRYWLMGRDDFDYCERKGIDKAMACERRAVFEKAVSTRTDQEMLDVTTKASGEKVYTLRKFHPHFEKGQLKYVFGYGIDITDLKEAELNLAEKEHYLRALINSVPDLILRVDKEGTLIDFKAQPRTKLANRLNSFLGKTLHEMWSEQADLHMKKIKEATRRKKLITYEYEIRSKESEKRTFEVRLVGNEREEVVMIVRNITEMKKTEEEKEKLINELSHRYNELMQYNNIVSHNLRAPVARIMGLAGLLEAPLDEADKTQAVNYMAEAARSLDTLLVDLNTILSTKSAVNRKIETFGIDEVIEIVRDNLKAQIEQSNARILQDIAADAEQCSSVKSYIQSAIFNLILNAIKYTKPGEQPVIRISTRRRDGDLVLEVADNGIGIDLEKHGGELFGLYKRFNRESEGKGLGLHMTKAQIESLGGKIEVSSTPGEGTTFRIILPEVQVTVAE